MGRTRLSSSPRRRTWAVFISGRGSNLQALLDLRADVEIRLVVSSSAKAPGLLRARRQGVPTLVLPKKIDWTALDVELRERGITHLFLAGFMKIVPAEFVDRWTNRILNVHPSLLPAYPGLHALEISHAEGAEMGVTVHVVTAGMDEGPRLLQRRCLRKGHSQSLETARIEIARTEQKLVREAVARWR